MTREEVKAFAAVSPGAPLTPFTYKPKPLGPEDIAVDVTHCGICHSDVHKVYNEWDAHGGSSTYPIVPGHEVIGHVVQIGSAVTNFKVGDRVGFGPQRLSCLQCDLCKAGDESMCSTFIALYDPDFGGYADHIRVHNRFGFKIPDKLDSASAAPLLCAGVTVYSPIKIFGPPPNQKGKVAIVGIGGLGHLAIQFSHALGHDVTAISSTPAKEAEARALGADHFVVASDIEKYVRTFEFILITASANLDWDKYVNALRPYGKLALVGLPEQKITVNPFSLVARRTVCGSLIGGVRDMTEMLELAAEKGVAAKIELVRTGFADADKANDAFQKCRYNKARFRMVLAYEKA